MKINIQKAQWKTILGKGAVGRPVRKARMQGHWPGNIGEKEKSGEYMGDVLRCPYFG